jgi:F1F0 ATPase subunit 2
MDAPAMTSFHFTSYVLLALQAGAWLAVGTLVGAFQFLTLRWAVGMLTAGQARLLSISTQFGRFAILIGVLAVLAGRFGATPLLLASAGIVAARTAIVRLELSP